MQGLLDAYGYAADVVDGTDFRFTVRTSDGAWRMQVQTYEREKIVRLYVYLNDAPFPPTRLGFVREVVEHLNTIIVHGRFVWDRGQVRYESSIDFFHRQRSIRAVERAFKACAFPLALWNHVVGLIDKPKVDAQSAVRYALLMEDAVEDAATITAGAIKLALKVVPGNGAASANENIEKPSLTLVT